MWNIISHRVFGWLLEAFFHFQCTVEEIWYLSRVSSGDIHKVKGKGFTIIIKLLSQGVGKWDWHSSSAWCVTGICLWWMPSFAEVCLSPVGPVPLWIGNYIFIRSEIVCLVIKALLWNVNPSGASSRTVVWFRFCSTNKFLITNPLVILISFSLFLAFLTHFLTSIFSF